VFKAALTTFHVDHVIPKAHRRVTGLVVHDLEHLAFACPRCNQLKGKKTKGKDPNNGVQRLFDPRIDDWPIHFVALPGGQIRALTSIGRATETVLRFNEDSDAILSRAKLRRARLWPVAATSKV